VSRLAPEPFKIEYFGAPQVPQPLAATSSDSSSRAAMMLGSVAAVLGTAALIGARGAAAP